MPYFSYTTCLHLYETLGWWRTGGLRVIHFAEEWNELHHRAPLLHPAFCTHQTIATAASILCRSTVAPKPLPAQAAHCSSVSRHKAGAACYGNGPLLKPVQCPSHQFSICSTTAASRTTSPPPPPSQRPHVS